MDIAPLSSEPNREPKPKRNSAHLDLVLDVAVEWARRRHNRSVTVVAVEIENLDAMRAHLCDEGATEFLTIMESRLAKLRGVTSVRTGDGFVFVSTGPRSHFDAFSLGNRAARTVSQPVVVGGVEFMPSAAIGIRLARHGNGDAPMLVRDARFAVDEAKRRGRSEIVVFSSELFLRRMSVRPDFRMQFEPIVSLDDGHVATYEATVLPGPTPGFADADTPEFELLLDALARAMTAWPLDVDASFNVSPERLVDAHFPDIVLSAADRYSLEPDRFVFEVNAGAVTEDLNGAQNVLTRLREDGWRVGVDAVGSTTPLLHTLALLPARFVKIDRTVVESADPTMWDLLSISDAARSLGITTVVTGNRTLPELALAIVHEFDLAQGPLFSIQPPVRIDPDIRSAPSAPHGRRPPRSVRTMGWWIGSGLILYIVLLVTMGILTIRKGHTAMFIFGLFFPFLWLIGAIMPDKRRGY